MKLTPAQQLQAMGLTLPQMKAESDEPQGRPRFDEVPDGPELHRILSLPRRDPPRQDDSEAEELASFLTARLAKNKSPYPGPLRTIQALALKEAWECRGLVAMMAVGTGKSLAAFLLPEILEAKRPLYLCPAGMVGPIQVEFARFAPHWRGPASYPVLSYSKLAAPKASAALDSQGNVFRASLLERIAPDLLVLDEAHSCGNSTSATTKRVKAYKKNHPECLVVVMSGTLLKTSINQGAHLMDWALGQNSPLPRDFEERMAWASALDASSGMTAFDPGALTRLLEKGEADDIDSVRKAVGRRILVTPGVIGTQGQLTEASLTVEAWDPVEEDPALESAFGELRESWCLPDGTELADGIELARHAFTLGNGHYQVWDPPPPEEWRAARNAWAKWCRQAIKTNRRDIHTEATMKDAVRKGIYDDGGLLSAWEAARDEERESTGLLEPASVAVWVSDEAVRSVEAWLAEHEGLVWVQNVGLGDRLARDLGLPFYGAKGLSQKGVHISKHPGGSAVSSIAANGTGKNLQGLWSKNLWLCTPNEQALGRTHRPGQKERTVANWVYLGCVEHLKSFWKTAKSKTSFAEHITSSTQKLSIAEILIPEHKEGGARWTSVGP